MFNASQWLSAALPQAKSANLAPNARTAMKSCQTRTGHGFSSHIVQKHFYSSLSSRPPTTARATWQCRAGPLLASVSTHLKNLFLQQRMPNVGVFFLCQRASLDLEWNRGDSALDAAFAAPGRARATLFLAGLQETRRRGSSAIERAFRFPGAARLRKARSHPSYAETREHGFRS